MIERHGWYRNDETGRVHDVLQWSSPQDVLLGIRPVADPDAPRTAPSLSEAFEVVPVRGMPECPKNHEAWNTIRTSADCW